MNAVRLVIGAVAAFVVTTALIFLMHLLIETADKSIDDKPTQRIADITMPKTEIEAQVKDMKPEKPPEVEEPPPELQTPDIANVDIDMSAVNMTPTGGVDIQMQGGSGLAVSDGEYLPIVKVAPIYPRRAQSRGIEGYCIVEYTVTRNGSVRDIHPVDCQPAGVFETASVKAAEKFKYKPRVVDGEPIEVAGVQNKFTYELEK